MVGGSAALGGRVVGGSAALGVRVVVALGGSAALGGRVVGGSAALGERVVQERLVSAAPAPEGLRFVVVGEPTGSFTATGTEEK